MTNMAAMLIYDKNLKHIFFSRANRPMTLKLGMLNFVRKYHQACSNYDWVALDPFYAKVKFGHLSFCMGKSKN